MLAKYQLIDNIPDDHNQWIADGVTVRSAEKLATTLRDNRKEAALLNQLATLIIGVPVGDVSDWLWRGPTDRFESVANTLGAPQLIERVLRLKK